MDFAAIFQLRTKKFWWMDVIFYFVISLLVSTLLCYAIFLVKNNMQREKMQEIDIAFKTVGTSLQKDQEKDVIGYQRKIADFTDLLANHEFASNAFAFMSSQTMPNVWFKQFSLDKKSNGVQLSGEAESMDAFSRQVAVFENNKYVKSLGALNSVLGESARVQFSTSVMLDSSIFSYLSNVALAAEAAAATETPASTTQPPASGTPAGTTTTTESASPASGTTTTATQPNEGTLSSEKLIVAFHLPLNPEVSGLVSQENHTVKIDVPYGTDVKNLVPSIDVSLNAKVSPDAGVLQDFTNGVTYTVTAQDGSVQPYIVTVNVLPEVVKEPKQLNWGFLLGIILIVIVIIAAVIFIFIWKRNKNKNLKSN